MPRLLPTAVACSSRLGQLGRLPASTFSAPSGAIPVDQRHKRTVLDSWIRSMSKSTDAIRIPPLLSSLDIIDSHLVFTLDGVTSEIGLSQLRDACTCAQCITSTRQRSLTSARAHLSARKGVPVLQSSPGGLLATWADGHKSTYSWEGLKEDNNQYSCPAFARVHWHNPERLESSRLYHDYPTDSSAMYTILEQVQKHGLAVVRGVPTDKTGDAECALRAFATSIGPIRNTFYGQTWDVKSMPDSKNVAYTDLDLGLHMDLLYFSEPPRFQLLHCLRNRVEGGVSYFVDSFAAAVRLEEQDPTAHRLLLKEAVQFEYNNDSHHLVNSWPILPSCSADVRAAVNWSPPFQKATRGTEGLYDAMVKWEAVLAEPGVRFKMRLEEGEMVFFDNRRVLHARTSFRDYTEEERRVGGVELVERETTRWLKGCYLDGDAVWDKMVALQRS